MAPYLRWLSPRLSSRLALMSSTTHLLPPTPAPLAHEQQHIAGVEGIVPTVQNIVASVNLDCRLDLKTIALHARNAEYNPKVGSTFATLRARVLLSALAFFRCIRADSQPKNNRTYFFVGEDGRDGRQVRGRLAFGIAQVCPHFAEARL